ncbi:protein kinase [Nocardiopsis kunsanensis]|uniref:Protein kinase n=1 Tax=Nocardiopsis kunsanensis TaxID=141693 RepID=A0A918XCK7_9ACTN|nr:WD40 repeat domain-containing serine/threonine protein kinase [Nocardiopsis kunsanensis]GHD25445.1 protein kinase [Nocardiopsis kunsanensis]
MHSLADDDPTRIGPYQITALLGSGGMGRVYLGFDRDGHPAAVKVVRAEYAYDPDFRERFAHELSLAQRVHGHGVPRVYAADTSGERPWLATAYVKGPSLQHLVERTGPLPEPSAVLLARAIAQALAGVHARGLAHRDLKPANVMVAAEGPQVIDFGIARATEDGRRTDDDTIAGTPGYMAPEASRREQAGPPADVFALGGVLVWALTGVGPFGDGHPSSVVYRTENLDPELDRIPPALRPLLAACLDKDPARRPTAAQVLQTLGGPVAPASDAAQWLPPRSAAAVNEATAEYDRVRALSGSGSKARGLLVAGAAAMALCLVGGFGFWAASDPFAPPEENQAAGEGEGEVPERERCDPTQHLAEEFTEAASETPTIPSNTDRVFSRFSNDGSVLAVSGNRGVVLWDWQAGTELARIEANLPHSASVPRFSPNDCLLAWGTEEGAQVYSLESGELTVHAEGREIRELAFSPDGDVLTVGDAGFDSAGGTYDIDLESGDTVQVHRDGEAMVSLVYGPEGEHLAGIDNIDQLRVWDAATGEVVYSHDSLAMLDIGTGLTLLGDGELIIATAEGPVHYDFLTDDGEGFVFHPDEDDDEDAYNADLLEFAYAPHANRIYTVRAETADEDDNGNGEQDVYLHIWDWDHTQDVEEEEIEPESEALGLGMSVHPEGEVVSGTDLEAGQIIIMSPDTLAEIDRLG